MGGRPKHREGSPEQPRLTPPRPAKARYAKHVGKDLARVGIVIDDQDARSGELRGDNLALRTHVLVKTKPDAERESAAVARF